MLYRLRVHISGREVGYLKRVDSRDRVEHVIVSRDIRATRFSEVEIGMAMAGFEGPDRPSSKAPMPKVTFGLVPA
ncbi:MAG: hypothetical protein EKK53_26690 [Burkholderiales bacterium]|nr:MAG: hypothetical protein EKK53_26690 [Burkholderiales bacterium]